MKNNFKTFDDIICSGLDRHNKQIKQQRGNDYWSASSLGKCKRYQVMSRARIVTNGKVNYSWKNAARDGHAAHEWRQEVARAEGALVAMEEAIIDEKLHYRGHYDVLVDLSGKLTLLDIKTQNSRAFKARSRLPGKIDECHKRQLGSYFYFLKRDIFPNLEAARLYYVNRNTCEREELEIYFEDNFFDSIIDELKTLNLYWDKNRLPKKEISYFCRICQFRLLCQSLRNRKDTEIKHAIQNSFSDTTQQQDKDM